MSGNKPIGPGFTPINVRRQTFREIGAVRIPTRDAAPLSKLDVQKILEGAAEAMHGAAPHIAPRDAMPSATHTVAEHIAGQLTLADVLEAAKGIGQRLTALEQKRDAALQQRMALQPRSAETQFEQPTHLRTQDRAPHCACGKTPCTCAPQPMHRGATTMDTQRHPQLAPIGHVNFGATRHATRDQNNFSEGKQVSRFNSQEQARLASTMPGAGPPNAHEHNTSRAQLGASGINQRGAMLEARSDDLSEAFASELEKIPSGQPNAGINAFNRAYHAARTSDAREKVESIFKDWQARYDAHGGRSPWAPRQPAVQDAPAWEGLYQANRGSIGGNPDLIREGSTLQMPGGGEHVVQRGESLSSIAAGGGGSDVPTPPSRPAGLGEGYGQGQEPGAAAGRNEEQMLKSPTESTGGESGPGPDFSGGVPTPPIKPAEYGGTGTGGKLPTTLLGGGGSPASGSTSSGSGPGKEPGGQAHLNVQRMLNEDSKPRRGK